MKFKDLHIVSKIMVFCAGLVCVVAFVQFATLVSNLTLIENPIGFQDISGSISNFAYGLGFLASAVIIELLRKILAAIENPPE